MPSERCRKAWKLLWRSSSPKGGKRQSYFLKSLGTETRNQENISIKPVLIEFDRIIRDAEAHENSKPPVRAVLSAAEIERMAEYVYGQAKPSRGTSGYVSAAGMS
jgi:hypothetical protein